MYSHLTGRMHGQLHPFHYGAEVSLHQRCTEAINAALEGAFGGSYDFAPIAARLAQLCAGRTPKQCRAILKVELKYGLLGKQFSPESHKKVAKSVMKALRDAKCLKHQAFGAEAPPNGEEKKDEEKKKNQFDPKLFGDILGSITGLVGDIIVTASAAENAKATKEANTTAGGQNTATTDSQIGAYATQLSQLERDREVAAAMGDAAKKDALNQQIAAENDRLTNQLANQKTSPWMVAGVAVGSVLSLGLIVLGVNAIRGRRAPMFPYSY